MDKINKVTVLGTGVLGSQIAFQTAYSGFEVSVYDIDEAAIAKARQRLDGLVETYEEEVAGADGDKLHAALARIALHTDLGAAVADADLVIEAIPEVLELKRQTYARLDRLAPEKTIFATNSSTLLPSAIKDATGRPDRFIALHFANQIWKFNTAEVMGGFSRDTCKNAPYNLFSLVDSFGCRIFLGASSVSAIGSQLRQQLLQRGHTHVGPQRLGLCLFATLPLLR